MKPLIFFLYVTFVVFLAACSTLASNDVFQVKSRDEQIDIKVVRMNTPVYLVKKDGTEIMGTLTFSARNLIWVALKERSSVKLDTKDIAFFEQPKESVGMRSVEFVSAFIAAPIWILKGMPDD